MRCWTLVFLLGLCSREILVTKKREHWLSALR